MRLKILILSNYLAKTTTNHIFKSNNISKKDKDYYDYCFNQFYSEFIFYIYVIIIGLFFRDVCSALVFLLSLPMIKRFAGGSHAPNEAICCMISYTIPFICILLSKSIHIDVLICIISFIFSSVLIIITTPIENNNKHFNHKNKIRLKKLYRWYITLLSILAIYFILAGFITYYYVIDIRTLIVTIDQIIGLIILRRNKNDS